jgi:diaminopimelate decarboxylase
MVGFVFWRGMTRLPLFPDNTTIENHTLVIAGHNLVQIAEEFGTPLYVYDRETMDRSVATYRDSLASSFPGPAFITYAGKAYLCTALAQWTQKHNLWLDCTGEGETAQALAGHVPREHLVAHGVNKSYKDLNSATRYAGTIVIDNLSELHRFASLLSHSDSFVPDIWLRLQPGLSVDTHVYTQTGHGSSKFGMEPEDLLEAARFCQGHGLPLQGIHFHLGSQFRDPAPLEPAIALALDIAKRIGFSDAWHFSPGGGWAVAYHEDELPHPDPETYIRIISKAVQAGCQKNHLPLPHLHLEPGRSIVARAGVAIYCVNTVKRQGSRTWLLIDGGLGDNPRFALYKQRYSCLPLAAPERDNIERVHIAGPYCESGDILIEDLPMPKIEEGEFIAVPVSGAYQLSMSSNYNGARRPAVLWLEQGEIQLIQRRETKDDLLVRDFFLSN